MKKTVDAFRSVVLSVLCLLLLTSQLFAGGGVAKVGGVLITEHEMVREINRLMPMNRSYHSGVSNEKINEIQEEALNTLIERALKFRYAIDNEIAVESIQYQDALKKFKSRFKTDEEYVKALGKETVPEFQASIYRKLTAEKAENVVVDGNVNIADEEVRAYYDENKSTYNMPRRFRASHILVRVDPSSNQDEIDAVKAKAEALLARAQAGEDFYNLAYYNSDDKRTKVVGGDLDYFQEGRTVAEFESAIKQMKVGDISGLVRTRFGFHIIKLTDIKDSRRLTFDEVKGRIKSQLENKMLDELKTKWLEELRAKYPVEMLVQMRPGAQ